MNHSEALDLLANALSAAQGQFQAVSKDAANPFFKSRYASLPAVVEAASPILAANGLSVSQLLGHGVHGDTLTTVLLHKSGQYLADTMHLRPVKNDPQAQGSATTYGRRYAYMAVLGLVADEDDDGNAGSAGQARPAKAKPTPAPKAATPPPADPARTLTRDELAQVREAAKAAKADWQTLGLHLAAIGVDAGADGEDITKDSVSRAIVKLTPAHLTALLARLGGGS